MRTLIKGTFFMCILALLCMPIVSAAPQRITAEGVYVMGEMDAPKVARDAARKEALRAATEQAGVYVESYTEAQHLTLTKDEVRIVAGAVLRILKEEDIPEVVEGTWQYRVRLTCEVDTSEVDLAALVGKNEQITQLEKERDDLKAQNSALIIRDKQTRSAAQAARGTRLENTVSYTQIFDDTTRLIQKGMAEDAAAEISRLIGDPRVMGDALAYAYCLRGQAYYAMEDYKTAVQNFRSADEITRTSEIYPLWRGDQYYGLICEHYKRYKDAAKFLRLAWEASDKTDPALKEQLERAESRTKRRGGGSLGALLGGILGAVVQTVGAVIGIG